MTETGYKRLAKLEAENRFVFHGSGLSLSALEPRQAFTVTDGKRVADGPPAVWASHLIDYAVFMALVNRENCPDAPQSMCDYEGQILTFGATRKTLDQLSAEASGYVHVFDKKDFELRGGSEWMSLKYVVPLEVILINRREFTCTIEVIEPLVKTAP